MIPSFTVNNPVRSSISQKDPAIQTSLYNVGRTVETSIRFRFEDCYDSVLQRVSLMLRLCDQLLPLLSYVEWLEIRAGLKESGNNLASDSMSCLEIFRPFTAMQSLCVQHIRGKHRTCVAKAPPIPFGGGTLGAICCHAPGHGLPCGCSTMGSSDEIR
jgi:hypothetical protein